MADNDKLLTTDEVARSNAWNLWIELRGGTARVGVPSR
jgi:hypothetical protein